MSIRTTFTSIVPEGTTAQFTGVVVDESGVRISSADLSALTLSLYPKDTPSTFINSRQTQNVLNTNNVTVTTSGDLTWAIQPGDNAIVDSTKSVEYHIALFEWTWNSGAKAGKHEVEIRVQNLTNV